MGDFFLNLFDTQGFPPRWQCGEWSSGHGWLHILSDLGTFAAYLAIPIILIYFVTRRRDLPFPRVFWFFAAFIFFCGATHLNEVVLFWHPYYRFAGVIKLATAVASWATVVALVPTVRTAMTLRTPAQLEREVAARTADLREAMAQRDRVEQELRATHALLEARIAARTIDLKRSNQDLEQFAYVASHDLQEPLRMIASYTALLEEEYGEKLSEEARGYIEFAVSGARRMQNLLSDLLAYSRLGSRGERLGPVDLNLALREVLNTLQFSVREAHATVTWDSELPTVIGDPVQLRQLLQNLVSNALKFRSAKPPEIHVAAVAEPGHWRISVRDNGIGIDPAYTEKAFTIFRRLHSAAEYEGTGLGLAICKRIVERHQGSIGVDSAAGEGATFFFTLPMRQEGDLEPEA